MLGCVLIKLTLLSGVVGVLPGRSRRGGLCRCPDESGLSAERLPSSWKGGWARSRIVIPPLLSPPPGRTNVPVAGPGTRPQGDRNTVHTYRMIQSIHARGNFSSGCLFSGPTFSIAWKMEKGMMLEAELL